MESSTFALKFPNVVSEDTAPSYPARAVPYLTGVERGYDRDIRTPLFDGASRESVVEQWRDTLDEHASEMVEELVKLEDKQASKIGPISLKLPFSERKDDIFEYYQQEGKPEYDLTELRALQGNYQWSRVLPSNRLRPKSYEDAAYAMPMNTNSGNPDFEVRRDVVVRAIEDAKNGKYYPAFLGWRGSPNGPGSTKQRVLWMYPISGNIIEARFQQVLLPHYQLSPHFAAMVSMWQVDNAITSLLFQEGCEKECTFMSTDYTGYDASLFEQQDWFFETLAGTFQHREASMISHMQYNLSRIPITCTRTFGYLGRHGLPSGSTFTNLLGSTVNADVQLSSPVVIRPDLMQFMGDDSAGLVRDVDTHIDHLERCGLVLNSEKQYINDRAVMYLQRLHHARYRRRGVCVGVYPTMRALGSLLGMEKFHRNWSKEMVSLRVLSVMENTKWHPLFHLFCKFIWEKGDPYLQTFIHDLENPRTREGVVKQANTIPGFQSAYNVASHYSGINDFATVQMMRSF
jgi:hypothetical protein